MTPRTIISQAAADGVRLSLSASDTIKVTGNQAAVARWVATIRRHKPAIVALLVAGLPLPSPDPLPPLPTCEGCRNLSTLRDRDGFRRCTAAHRRYNPAPDVGRRCEDFRPQPGDPDQRTGRKRWPWLDRNSTAGATAPKADRHVL